MYLLIDDIKNNVINYGIPKKFIKNKYSSTEYSLIRYGLLIFYNITDFDIEYLESGKPFFKNLDINISISHDNNLVCVLLSSKRIGVDLQFFYPVSNKLKKFLNIPIFYDSIDSVIEFSKREAFIKLFNLSINNINNLNLSLCKYKLYLFNDYVVVCAFL